jgi:hypothetical protein
MAISRILENLRGRPDLGLRRLQDRVLFWPGPRRERLSQVTVVGIVGWDRLALPVCEPVGEGAVRGGQVLDPLARFSGLFPIASVSSSRWAWVAGSGSADRSGASRGPAGRLDAIML